ncbi:MAG: sodium:alanine symporter family protein [Candidatus Faecousia sp.]|nr:sodium:alanine symporter family protein [Candidatus Faecousia sp.]
MWGPPLITLLVGTGIYLTVRLGLIQVFKLPTALRLLFSAKNNGEGDVSSFKALCVALAATVGTGNIVGVATAVKVGGPGAIFWMWVSAFFGMATNYTEAVLAQKYRSTDEKGKVVGGPVYYIKAAFPNGFGKFLAGFFSVAIILALGFMGNMVQSNSISDAMFTAFGVPKVVVGILVALVAGFIFLGGVQRIVSVTEKLVPVMALLYIVGSLAVLVCNWRNLPGVFVSIFTAAFNPSAVLGGAAGITVQKAMRFGVARGLFSNEAGMGSTPHAHALAKVAKPQDQGVVAMIGVFIDTFVVLTMTALVILTSGVLGTVGADGELLSGTALAQAAFNHSFGSFGNAFVAICLLFFAFSTIIGWYFFGESNVKALFKGKKAARVAYGVIALIFIAIGSFQKVSLVWDMSDMFNGLMVIPNLLAVLALSGVVAKFAKDDDNLTGK